MICNYQDSATFYKTIPSGYGNNKTVEEQATIPVIFQQNTGFLHANNQDSISADAVLYVDPSNAFVINNHNRLEGMFVVVSPFGSPESLSWYKVTQCTVNRDHLLKNKIDNVELLLKKSAAPKLLS